MKANDPKHAAVVTCENLFGTKNLMEKQNISVNSICESHFYKQDHLGIFINELLQELLIINCVFESAVAFY